MVNRAALQLTERYDAAIDSLEQDAIARVNTALDRAYRSLEQQLRDSYPKLKDQGGLLVAQRKLLIMDELGSLLQLIKPEQVSDYEQMMSELLQLSSETGATMADEVIREIDPNHALSPFVNIPIEAVALQARDGVQRLARHSEDFRTRASAVVEQGLIQGWGATKVTDILRQNLQTTRSRAETIARTEVNSALNAAAKQRYAAAEIDYIQLFTTPADACPYCSARNGNVYERDKLSVPLHPRCLPDGVFIHAPTVRAGVTRPYSGKLIHIRTASGAQLSATPNHPIYVKAGFRPIQRLAVGDCVYTQPKATEQVRAIAPDRYNQPHLIETIIANLEKGPNTRQAQQLTDFFHGDGCPEQPYWVHTREPLPRFVDAWPELIADPIVLMKEQTYDGPVHNLETVTGWYFANKILSSNCRCVITPWLPEWQADGLTDDKFIKQYRQQQLDNLAANGLEPNLGPTYFEQQAGLKSAPKPYWKPGQRKKTRRKPKPQPAAETQAIAPPKAPAKPVVSPTGFPEDLASLELVKKLGGSTGAELVRDPRTEKLYVRKRGANPDHIREEVAADAAYRAMGVAVPNAQLYETPTGPVKLAEYIEGGRSLAELSKAEKAKAYQQLQKDFAIDALLGNTDVIGLSYDNILIDAQGKAWRIDNGGALRYRAMGAPKQGDRWNDYPTELWSMRDAKINAQTNDAFGQLSHLQLVEQIEAISRDRAPLLDAVPDAVRPVLARRLEEAERLADISRTLERDRYREPYISQFTQHSLGLRNAGVIDQLPREFKLAFDNQLYDENDKLFDDLREPNGPVAEMINYMSSQDGNYRLIEDWADEQAYNSWRSRPQALKWEVATYQRDIDPQSQYWQFGEKSAEDLWKKEAKRYGETTYHTSFAIFHAWTYEQLDRIDMPNSDRQNQTFRVIRTEDKSIIKRKYGLKPGDTNVTMTRGAAESTSMFSRFTLNGKETTVQNIPYHRALGFYAQSREPSRAKSLFAGDRENELVAHLDGISFDYIPLKNWADAKPNYKPPTTQPSTTSVKANQTPAQSFQEAAASNLPVTTTTDVDLAKVASVLPYTDLTLIKQKLSFAEIKKATQQIGIPESYVANFGSTAELDTWMQVLNFFKSAIKKK